MKTIRNMIAVLWSLVALSADASAQTTADEPDQFLCEWASRTTTPGAESGPIGQKFEMTVHPSGEVEGHGIDMSSAGRAPFQFEGAWAMQGGEFSIEGRQIVGKNGSSKPFSFVARLVSGRFLRRQIKEDGYVYAAKCALMR